MPTELAVRHTTKPSVHWLIVSLVSSMAAPRIASRTARISPGGPLSNSRLDNLRLWDVYRNADYECFIVPHPIEDFPAVWQRHGMPADYRAALRTTRTIPPLAPLPRSEDFGWEPALPSPPIPQVD
jgi:hypothetical protein